MSDSLTRTITLLELDAGEGETAYLTNKEDSITVGSLTYLSSPNMGLAPSALTGDMSQSEYTIKNLDNAIGILARLSLNVPYPKVGVVLKEVTLDDSDAVTDTEYLFKGLIYKVEVRNAAGYIDLLCRSYLYYLDTTAGLPCTEQCAVSYFGDTVCQKVVQFEDHVIASISGFNITLGSDPVLTTAFLFNNGYVEYGASRIKIRYHESGRVFQLSRPVPSYWDGATVTIATGCDKTIDTCRNIHNNESRFLGIGHSMVDYNPLYENP